MKKPAQFARLRLPSSGLHQLEVDGLERLCVLAVKQWEKGGSQQVLRQATQQLRPFHLAQSHLLVVTCPEANDAFCTAAAEGRLDEGAAELDGGRLFAGGAEDVAGPRVDAEGESELLIGGRESQECGGENDAVGGVETGKEVSLGGRDFLGESG